MRFFLPIAVAGLILSGCAHAPSASAPKAPAGKTRPAPVITPVNLLQGKVVTLNTQLRFVIVDFGLGQTPAVGQTLDIYRNGEKIGEVKISEQSRSNLFAADVVAGNVQVGDVVKPRP